jgi:phage terminase small subunit
MEDSRDFDLNPKQKRFVEEYLLDLNATAAYIRAGYEARGSSAEVNGSRLLSNAKIAAAVQEALGARSARTEITTDRVLEELAVLSFSNIYHYQIGDDGNVILAENVPASAVRAISSIKKRITQKEDGGIVRETEIKLWDKPAAIQMTAKHLGMLTERIEQTHKFDLGSLGEDELSAIEELAARFLPKPA